MRLAGSILLTVALVISGVPLRVAPLLADLGIPLVPASMGTIAFATDPSTRLVSLDSSGGQVVGGPSVDQGAVSADGRFVIFQSEGDAYVPEDTNGLFDIFLRDLQVGTTQLVSISLGGVAGNGPSFGTTISSDARFAAFSSLASDLAAGDTNGQEDVFVRDLVSGVTMLASVAPAGVSGNGSSSNPSISADGRYVAFMSGASDLVADDGNGWYDVFVRDLLTQSTERVSVSSTGGDADHDSGTPEIAGGGRYVVFESGASNLVPGSPPGRQIYVRDRELGTTTLLDPNENPEVFVIIPVSISADGRFVAFATFTFSGASPASASASTFFPPGIFVRDRVLGVTSQVFEGEPMTARALSADGQILVVEADTDLVSEDTNGQRDVYAIDWAAGVAELVSVNTSGMASAALSSAGAVSADGRFVAFSSDASDLVAEDVNGAGDVFLRDRGADGDFGEA